LPPKRRFSAVPVPPLRRLLPLTAGVVAAAAMSAPAQAAVVVDAGADRVTATAAVDGPATISVVREDAVDGHDVVVGLHSDNVDGGVMTVNTFFNAANDDCWEGVPGQLRQWTPDLRGGDVVTFQPPAGPAETVTVAADADAVVGGPVAGCEAAAPYARNAITATSVGAITSNEAGFVVSGVAQPFATSVAVSVNDAAGHAATATSAVLGPAWSATFPAPQIGALSDGALTVDAVYSIIGLDAAGTPGSIRGATPLAVTKRTAAGATTITTPTPAGGGLGAVAPRPGVTTPVAARLPAIGRLATARRMRLTTARRAGLRLAFTVPANARFARVELRRGARVVRRLVVRAGRPGSRQVVRLRGSVLRALRRGTYTLRVAAGPSRSSFGPASTARVTLR
jgi:hypothetical protein